MKKNTDKLLQNNAEYEQVIRDQRKRIIDLRDENHILKSRVEELEQERKSVADAMLLAQHSRERILADARDRAEKILAAAETSRKKSELAVKYYCSSLKDLETRCANILEGISRELNRPDEQRLRIVK